MFWSTNFGLYGCYCIKDPSNGHILLSASSSYYIEEEVEYFQELSPYSQNLDSEIKSFLSYLDVSETFNSCPIIAHWSYYLLFVIDV